MKKLLLTLSSIATMTAPAVAVVSCGIEEEYEFKATSSLIGETLLIKDLDYTTLEEVSDDSPSDEKFLKFLNGFADIINDENNKSAKEIKAEDKTFIISNFNDAYGGPGEPITLGDIADFGWVPAVLYGRSKTSDQVMAYTFFLSFDTFSGNVDATSVQADLEELSLVSTYTKPPTYVGDAHTEEDAQSVFGIDATEFAKIIEILGDDWSFSYISATDTTNSTIAVRFKKPDESGFHIANIPITWASE